MVSQSCIRDNLIAVRLERRANAQGSPASHALSSYEASMFSLPTVAGGLIDEAWAELSTVPAGRWSEGVKAALPGLEPSDLWRNVRAAPHAQKARKTFWLSSLASGELTSIGL